MHLLEFIGFLTNSLVFLLDSLLIIFLNFWQLPLIHSVALRTLISRKKNTRTLYFPERKQLGRPFPGKKTLPGRLLPGKKTTRTPISRKETPPGRLFPGKKTTRTPISRKNTQDAYFPEGASRDTFFSEKKLRDASSAGWPARPWPGKSARTDRVEHFRIEDPLKILWFLTAPVINNCASARKTIHFLLNIRGLRARCTTQR